MFLKLLKYFSLINPKRCTKKWPNAIRKIRRATITLNYGLLPRLPPFSCNKCGFASYDYKNLDSHNCHKKAMLEYQTGKKFLLMVEKKKVVQA